MTILGIETSCDETAAAVVKSVSGKASQSGAFAVSSAISSSQDSHVRSGGIIPEVAARKQIESIIPVIDEALKIAKLTTKSEILFENLDAIAVTYGPGLIGSLLVGVETAKTLSLVWDKPLIPVNHLVAHIYANWLGNPQSPQFPLIALVVSGGHTDFVFMKSHQDIKYIGGTRDDAAGEAFDKTARLLGLPYPGGPSIAKSAEKHLSFLRKQESRQLNLFPRPMINSDDLDMSFSGLKTAVKNHLTDHRAQSAKLRFGRSRKLCLSQFTVHQLAAEIQEAIVDTLVAKSIKAIEKYRPKSFLLAGGVSANKRLREKISESLKGETKVFIPDPKYSTDNAVMIATAALYNYKPIPWEKVTANPGLSIEE